MNEKENTTIFLLALFVFFTFTSIDAQVITDPEHEYSRIRTLASEGKLTEAETAAANLVNLYPSYGDARILLARIMAWQKKYEPALEILDSLLLEEPGNSDALEAQKDIQRWVEGEKKSGPKVLHKPGSDEILHDSSGFDLRTGLYYDTFNEPYFRSWKVFNAGAGRYFPAGKIIGGVNIGHIYMGLDTAVSETEIQLESEAYLKLNTDNYCWLSYDYSPGSYFPGHRAAAEIWHNFSHGWVASAGMNYYNFNRNIFIASGSVEKYLGSYWLSGKVNLYFKENGITTSFYLNIRKYFNDYNYLQFTVGTGTAPDEPYDIQTDVTRLKAQIFRLVYYTFLSERLSFRAGIGYSYEEYQESVYRNRFDGSIGLIYLLPDRK